MEAVGKSCRGRSRAENEDRYFISYMGPLGVFAVADGMGGHVAGGVASSLAIKAMEKYVESFKAAPFSPEDFSQLKEMVQDLFARANRNIWNYALEYPSCQGMGTTLTMALCSNDQVVLGHVGDSRCYLVKEDDIVLLTEDHSLVNYLVRKGEITEEQALNHPQRHVLTRALGIEDSIEADIYVHQVRATEYLLLCTDGLTSLVTPEEIHRTVFEQPHMDSAVDYLVDLANDRGGYDNITLVIVKGVGTKR